MGIPGDFGTGEGGGFSPNDQPAKLPENGFSTNGDYSLIPGKNRVYSGEIGVGDREAGSCPLPHT